MAKKKKKQQKIGPLLLVMVLTAALSCAAILYFLQAGDRPSKAHVAAEDYFGAPSGDEVIVVATEGKLDKMAVSREGAVYIDYEDVKEHINDAFYYDEESQLLSVTTPLEIINFEAGADEKTFLTEEDVLMISSELISAYSDVEFKTFEDPHRIVIRTSFDMESAYLNPESCVRRDASVKSPILKDIVSGEYVTVLDRGETFTRVSTEDGYIGYAENTFLAEDTRNQTHVSPLGEYTGTPYDGDVVLLFHQTDSQASNDALLTSVSGVSGANVIAPTWYFLKDTEGNLVDLSSASYVKEAHQSGYKVWAVANDFDGGISSAEATKTALSSTPIRQKMAETIVTSAKAAGCDGINLDFENVNKDAADAYLAFVREMSALCRREGLTLSVDSYVPQPYNLYLNRKAQAEAVDYIVTMAYDEHYNGSESAGSVSSISWVKKALYGTLDEVPKEKIIIALPFYTRLWETSGTDKPKTRAMGMREAMTYVEDHGMKVSFDETAMQDYAVLEGTVKYEIWLENARSFSEKLNLLRGSGIGGIAAWKLGLETPDIWKLIEDFRP